MLVLLTLLALAAPAPAQDLSMVPVTVDGEAVRLAKRIYKPAVACPSPKLHPLAKWLICRSDPAIISAR